MMKIISLHKIHTLSKQQRASLAFRRSVERRNNIRLLAVYDYDKWRELSAEDHEQFDRECQNTPVECKLKK